MLLAHPLRRLGGLGTARLGGRRLSTILSPAVASLRARQRDELQSLETSLVRLGADDADTAVLRDTIGSLNSLFLLCVVGEFNAGKSSLINALLGQKHCREGVLPTTSEVTILKHPSVPFEPVGAALGAVAVDVGTEWLRDVHLVDTPGTNTLDATHTALTEAFLPRADLVRSFGARTQPRAENTQPRPPARRAGAFHARRPRPRGPWLTRRVAQMHGSYRHLGGAPTLAPYGNSCLPLMAGALCHLGGPPVL